MNAPYLILGLLCGLAIGYAFGWQHHRSERPAGGTLRAWKRVKCWLTLNHLDPGVMCVGQQLTACKKCGKVWRVWP